MIPGGALLTTFAPLLVVVGAAIVLFIAAVWFVLHVVAHRIRRAIDRAKIEGEESVDRPG